ncbi:hypothetical protein RJ641_009573 [Dillenia turbinata]|uniref:Endonuclease/exonuclease/phosphatase domain-containing protein n=1 Tax=Dillenia turbinata TaxID=194707 RepID=A0AAN8Z552_9MAGN
MKRCSGSRATPFETPMKSNPFQNLVLSDHHHHQIKRRRIIVSDSEAQPPSQSPSKNPNSFSFRSHKHRRHQKKAQKREWTLSSRDCSSYKDRVIILSYNVLGVANASKHPDLYYNVPAKYLKWRRRCKIICEEEVDRFDDLDKLLQEHGFKGVYKARTGESCDGCAIFWKEKLLTVLHHENIEFQKFGLRDNVAQLSVFELNRSCLNSCASTSTSEDATQRLLVGNIHVLFNPKRGDIKLGQMRLFLEKAHKLSQEWGNIPVVLAGDFNSMPQLDILLHDRRRISGQFERGSQFRTFRHNANYSGPLVHEWSQEELRLATGNETTTLLQHSLKLCSAYLGVPGTKLTRDGNGEPSATSYHSEHTEQLVPLRVLETLPMGILRRTQGLPNKMWGSDHLALVCELAFADNANST